MSNICTYIYDPNILTQAKVNREFALIHKYLCYATGASTVSTSSISTPFLTNSPVGGAITLNGAKIRDVNNGGDVVYYQIPSNFLSQSIETVSKNGAFSSAVVTAVGPYDKVAVTGGDNTSYVTLSNVPHTCTRIRYFLKLQVDTLGATPLIGIQLTNSPGTEDTNTSFTTTYVNLSTGVVTRLASGFASDNLVSYNSGGTFATTNSILTIEYVRDSYNGSESFSVRNPVQGTFIESTFLGTIMADGSNDGFSSSIRIPSIILAGGTYTILDFKMMPISPRGPKLMIIGDSVGIGYNILPAQAITNDLINAIPYNISQNCGLGQYIYSIARSNVQEVIAQKPEVVVCFFYLSLFYGEFIASSGSHAAYMTAFNSIMNSIIGCGGIPVLIQPPSWPLDNGNTPAWNIFVTQQAALFPGTLILNLQNTVPTYDSSGYHPDPTYYTTITNAIVSLLQTNGLL